MKKLIIVIIIVVLIGIVVAGPLAAKKISELVQNSQIAAVAGGKISNLQVVSGRSDRYNNNMVQLKWSGVAKKGYQVQVFAKAGSTYREVYPNKECTLTNTKGCAFGIMATPINSNGMYSLITTVVYKGVNGSSTKLVSYIGKKTAQGDVIGTWKGNSFDLQQIPKGTYVFKIINVDDPKNNLTTGDIVFTR